jgi:hypothetical protein
MVPGQTFVKTWRVKNTGTCNWDAGFKFVFIREESMGGVPLLLSTPVSPGAEMDISISMTAPNKAGDVRGHWRRSTASGTLFGADVFVAIIVGDTTGKPTSTVTSTATAGAATPTPTPTSTNTPGS